MEMETNYKANSTITQVYLTKIFSFLKALYKRFHDMKIIHSLV